MACLDTSTFVDLSGRSGARSMRRAREKLKSLSQAGEDFFTTRFNVAELWVGVERSRDKEEEQKKIETLLEPLSILEFEERAAMVFGRIVGHVYREGTPIGDRDALIASVCIVNGQSILTRNLRHFAAVPGLVVETY